jgi:hypothetical protein
MKVRKKYRRPKGRPMTEKEIRDWFEDGHNEAMRRAASRDIHKAWIEFCVRIGEIPMISRTMLDPDYYVYSDYCAFRGWLDDDEAVDDELVDESDA